MVWWVEFLLTWFFGDSFLHVIHTYIFNLSALEGRVSNGRQLGRIQLPRKPESKNTVEGIIDFWF